MLVGTIIEIIPATGSNHVGQRAAKSAEVERVVGQANQRLVLFDNKRRRHVLARSLRLLAIVLPIKAVPVAGGRLVDFLGDLFPFVLFPRPEKLFQYRDILRRELAADASEVPSGRWLRRLAVTDRRAALVRVVGSMLVGVVAVLRLLGRLLALGRDRRTRAPCATAAVVIHA